MEMSKSYKSFNFKTSVMAKQILNLPVIKKVVKKLSLFSSSNKNMSEFISLINEDHFIR